MGELARHLNFWDIYLMSLGQIIGAGIFILIGKAAKHANNQTWLAFEIAGILSILSGFSYVELSQVFKSNAAENEYIASVFGKPIGLIYILMVPISSAHYYMIKKSKKIVSENTEHHEDVL